MQTFRKHHQTDTFQHMEHFQWCAPVTPRPSWHQRMHFCYTAALHNQREKIQTRISQGYLCPQGQRRGNNAMTTLWDKGWRPNWAEQWWVILALTWQQLLYFVSAAVTPEMLFTFLSHAWPLLKFAFLIKHLSMSNEAKTVQELQYFRSKLVLLILLVYFVWNLEKGHWIDWC